MTQPAAKTAVKPASLDALYALIEHDLKQTNQLIITRVQNDVALIGSVAQHIVASGGKRIRPAMTLIAAQLCGHSGKKHIPLAAAIEFIHTATLLHDDVVDESKLRRGLPTANEVFGNKASVLVGDFLLGQAFQIAVEQGSLNMLRILSDAAAIISKGEVLQLMTEGDLQTGLDRYLEVVSSKTAALFAAACELGASTMGNETLEARLRDYGQHIGIAFQLIDDVLDYGADQDTLGKTLGDDFREGKITLPVIFAYAQGSEEEKAFWQRTLGDRNQTAQDFDKALNILKKYNCLAQSVAMAETYCAKAREALAPFPSGGAKSAMLDIVDFCINRAY